jgi:WD40 repeat protein/tRNA A-37 threonylcarbamoyl transferase component Bud32
MAIETDSLIGAELGGYRLESVIARGGMGVVYLAEHRRLERQVALKVLAPELAESDGFRERFLQESRIAAGLNHPNVIPIHDAGEADGVLFIAMRYVEGVDLADLIDRDGPLPVTRALAIVSQVAGALDAAHARGLVHRDVKPGNVLIAEGDHAYLTDFGVTKQVSDSVVGMTAAGEVLGTVAYMSPESIEGEEADHRADVYSLGCVLYECLTGSPPFEGSRPMAVMFAHVQEEPPAASASRPELPVALDAVVARALAKEPDQRYSTCRELAQAAVVVTVDEASRLLADVASRAAVGRSDLGEVEAELAGKVIELQLVREQARALSSPITPARVAAEGVCPFKGLASFEPADADYFFGRERLVGELVARLVGANFLGIVGPSGSGKSSVLRAGLLPALAGGILPGSDRWRRALMRPGERPLDALRGALVSGARDPIDEALAALGSDERLLLAVDQLEELFTACADESQRAAFVEALTRAAGDSQGRAVVTVAVRADFYGRFASYPELAELLGANHVLVGAMQASELRRAMELPASRVGLRVEPELADALVDDVEGEPGALPLLSTALLELWLKREEETLTLAAYRESGGVHGAVARLAEGTYGRIPDKQKPLVRAIMLRLVAEGEGEAAVRRRASLGELDLERSPEAREMLDALADSRLVTVSEGSVEVAHEALLREWPRLREWIEEDGQGRRLRRHITQAATEWDAAERDQGELYRGARLAAALDWSSEHAFELNELEREFVAQSREASERETKRVRRTNHRLRGLLIVVGVLLAAAIAGGIFALIQRGDAKDAALAAEQSAHEARTSAAEARAAETAQLAQRLGAQALVDEDLDRSLLLARQAVAIDDSPQTRSYLLADLLRAPAAAGIMYGRSEALRAAAISPDGNTLAVADFFGGLLLFDTETYEEIGEPQPEPIEIFSLAYSPDGDTIAVGGNGLRLVDAETREVLAELEDFAAARMAFTSDGSLLAVLNEDVTFHDATTLEQVGAPIELEGSTPAYTGSFPEYPHFALTPDGRSIVTASDDGELAWWDIESRTKMRTLPIAEGHHALALSPDGRTAAVGVDGGIQLVDLRTGDTRTATGALADNPSWVLFSPDSKTVVTTGLDGRVTLWDAATGVPRETLRGHSDSTQQPVFSPDGETLYTVSHDGTAIAWNVAGDNRLQHPLTFTHDRAFDPVYDRHPGEFSPDGRLIAFGLKEHGIELWDAADLQPVGAPLRATGGEVKVVAFSPDGRTLAAGTSNGIVTIWDLPSRSLRQGPLNAGEPIEGASISWDGALLATAGPDGVELWDMATGTRAGQLGSESVGDVAFSPTGSVLAFVQGDTGDAEIWDVAGRSRLATLEVEPGFPGEVLGSAVAFSPDGRTLATSGLGQPVHVWDVESGKLLHKLEQGGAGVMTLEFSPDGSLLAVSGFEPVASLWDVASGTQIGPSLKAGQRRTHVALSPDGRRLLQTHGNGQAALWDIDPASWADRACAIANRTLTRDEWERFLPGRPYEPACGA